MPLETIFSIAMIGVLIWAVRINLPRAIREKDGLALAAALLTILIALAGWALVGVGVRSEAIHAGDRARPGGKAQSRVKCRVADRDATTDWLHGDWHLLDLDADERNIPQHRMDLRFATRAGALHGAILNRNTGDEIPLAAVAFDGTALRYQMAPPPGRPPAQMPWMVMARIADRFEGRWETSPGVAAGPTLKLVRARG
jgi:hypothetical protein